MRFLISGAVATVLAVSAFTGSGSAEDQPATAVTPPQAEVQTVKPVLRNNCTRLFSQQQFKRHAKKVYSRNRVTAKAALHMRMMVRCQHSPKAERKMRSVRRDLASQFHRRKAEAAMISALTPYHCGSAGNFAIPCYIIACESGFSWGAYNPSGAVGPYQLLGHGAPFPVRTQADRLAHHRIASNLWNGGRGRSAWVC